MRDESLNHLVEGVFRHRKGDMQRPAGLMPAREIFNMHREMPTVALEIGAFLIVLIERNPHLVEVILYDILPEIALAFHALWLSLSRAPASAR